MQLVDASLTQDTKLLYLTTVTVYQYTVTAENPRKTSLYCEPLDLVSLRSKNNNYLLFELSRELYPAFTALKIIFFMRLCMNGKTIASHISYL